MLHFLILGGWLLCTAVNWWTLRVAFRWEYGVPASESAAVLFGIFGLLAAPVVVLASAARVAWLFADVFAGYQKVETEHRIRMMKIRHAQIERAAEREAQEAIP